MSIGEFLEQYKLLEYIVTGIFGIGIIIVILFSSPIEKLRSYMRDRFKRKRHEQLKLMQEANKKLEKQLEEFSKTQQEFHDSYIESQEQFHAYVESNFDEIHATLHQLEQSDQEQLRQLMDNIYYKYVNEKRIPQHQFDRYEGLYTNYKKEKGNGKYDNQWKEVCTWERYV